MKMNPRRVPVYPQGREVVTGVCKSHIGVILTVIVLPDERVGGVAYCIFVFCITTDTRTGTIMSLTPMAGENNGLLRCIRTLRSDSNFGVF